MGRRRPFTSTGMVIYLMATFRLPTWLRICQCMRRTLATTVIYRRKPLQDQSRLDRAAECKRIRLATRAIACPKIPTSNISTYPANRNASRRSRAPNICLKQPRTYLAAPLRTHFCSSDSEERPNELAYSRGPVNTIRFFEQASNERRLERLRSCCRHSPAISSTNPIL
jgi:hypothetical protein